MSSSFQQSRPSVADLIELFNESFQNSENTRLVAGMKEPIYLPANNRCKYNQVVYANGFFSSALHEIAHWCIAGEKRRQLTDYGYWYVADGRSVAQQREFEVVEVVPQALEWIFACACGIGFVISVDNLNGEMSDTEPFKKAVYQQVIKFCKEGLNARSEQFRAQLAGFFETPKKLSVTEFELSHLSL